MAMKSTSAVINGEVTPLFKDPITDSGMKKSAKGLLSVIKNHNGSYKLLENVTPEEEQYGELIKIYENGTLYIDYRFSDIRKRVLKEFR
jgi:nicotinamide phosphoribosyltransferase